MAQRPNPKKPPKIKPELIRKQGQRLAAVSYEPEKKAACKKEILKWLSLGYSANKALHAYNIPLGTAYKWRAEDKKFDQDWMDAAERGICALEDEAVRRAAEGVERPIVHQGVIVATITDYSDSLLQFVLKARRPERYKDRVAQEVTGQGGGPVQVASSQALLTKDEFRELVGSVRDKF